MKSELRNERDTAVKLVAAAMPCPKNETNDPNPPPLLCCGGGCSVAIIN